MVEGGAPADPALPLIPRFGVQFFTLLYGAVLEGSKRKCDPV